MAHEKFIFYCISIHKIDLEECGFSMVRLLQDEILIDKDLVDLKSYFDLSVEGEGFRVYFDASQVVSDCVLMYIGKVITYALWQLEVNEKNY